MGMKARSLGAIATQLESTKAKLGAIKQQEQQLAADLDELQGELVQRLGLDGVRARVPAVKPRKPSKRRASPGNLRDAVLAALGKTPQKLGEIAVKLEAQGIAVDKRRLATVGIKPLVKTGDVKKTGDRGQARYSKA